MSRPGGIPDSAAVGLSGGWSPATGGIEVQGIFALYADAET